MASLISADGASFELAEAETLVGRGSREFSDPPKADVGPLQGGATVSRRHIRVFRRADQWYLRVEPEARNQTLVAGRRIPGGEEAPLGDGTRIQIGDVVLTLKAPLEVAAPSPDSTMADFSDQPLAEPAPVRVAPIAATPVVAPPPPAPEPEPTAPVAAPVGSAAAQPTAPVAPPPQAAPAAAPKAPTTASWPGRLPGKPATLTALGVGEFKRVNPFRGLMIDEEAWADAHEYHRLQQRLHLLSGHGWGVVEGLEVIADPHAPNTLLVRPGVAVDPHGRALILAQERRLAVSADQGAAIYVVLRWHEELAAPQRFWNDLDEYTRVVERSAVQIQATPPAPPAIELARLVPTGALRNAPNPLDPQPGELDLRFRERLLVRPRPDLAVAQLMLSAEDAGHRLGLRFLLREIGLTTAYRPRWAGAFRLEDPLPAVSLLYLSGAARFTAGGDAVGRLRDFLRGGGVLLTDACEGAKGAEFAAAAEALATSLDCGPRPIGRAHPLLTTRHVFGEPPLPNKGAKLVEGGGLVLSTADFGCAWQGGPRDRPLAREAIRAALEFGVNVAVYARQRQRPLEAAELEA